MFKSDTFYLLVLIGLFAVVITSTPSLESPDAIYHIREIARVKTSGGEDSYLYYKLAALVIKENGAELTKITDSLNAVDGFEYNSSKLMIKPDYEIDSFSILRWLQCLFVVALVIFALKAYKNVSCMNVPADVIIKVFFLIPQVIFLLTNISSDYFMYIFSIFLGMDIVRRKNLFRWILFSCVCAVFVDRSWIYMVWFSGWFWFWLHVEKTGGLRFASTMMLAAALLMIAFIRFGGIAAISPSLEGNRLWADSVRGYDPLRGLSILAISIYKAFGNLSFLPTIPELLLLVCFFFIPAVPVLLSKDGRVASLLFKYIVAFLVMLALFSNQAQGKYYLSLWPLIIVFVYGSGRFAKMWRVVPVFLIVSTLEVSVRFALTTWVIL
jgi:hypothetical protein